MSDIDRLHSQLSIRKRNVNIHKVMVAVLSILSAPYLFDVHASRRHKLLALNSILLTLPLASKF